MKIKHALDQPGVRAAIGSVLGITQQAIANWKSRNAVPVEHCAEIEKLTNGTITRKDLRPDDWASIWPELAINKTSGHKAKDSGKQKVYKVIV